MSDHGKTKDECFMIKLYEIVQRSGDEDLLVDRYETGRLAGITEKGVEAISKLLLRANFIEKEDERFIRLTPHGKKLAERLLHE
jgi:hypothetical protein